MDNQQDNLKELQKLSKIFNTDKIVTQDVIEEVLRGILNIISSFKKGNEELNSETRAIAEVLLSQVEEKYVQMLQEVDDITKSSKENMQSEYSARIAEMKALVEEMKLVKPLDGKDADEELIVEKVLSQIVIPEQKDIVVELDTGEDIVQKINSVTGEDDKYKIDAKHIKNLPENTRSGGRGLAKVFTDDTMEGDGTISNPLTVVGGGGGGGTWGSITGTLSDQTDLQTALNAKYDASNPSGYTSNTGTVTSVGTAGLISGGTITTTGTITTSMATNKLVGRGTAGTGVMEEITLGTGLSLSGTTLNAAGGSPGGSSGQLQYNNSGAFGGTAAGTYATSGSLFTYTAQSATDKPLIIKGATSQTANMQEWQNSSSTALLSVDSAGALQSYQATGAKTFFKHTRNDGEAAKIYTSDGYNLWIQGGNGGALHLGNPGGGGLSHSTTVYGGEAYFTTAFNTRSAIRVIGMVDRYGDSTQSDLEVQLTSHLVSDSGAYNSSAIFRGKTIKGYLSTRTITDASTVRIDAAPTAGTNATLTNTWALHVVAGASKFGGPIQLPGYTVATLPAGKVGYCAYVTDALAPVALANVVGGGAVTVKVFYDGTNWIVQ